MGLYIRPASLVEEQGILSTIPRTASWSLVQSKLVQGQSDFDHVLAAGGDFYIIENDLARQAS